MALIVDKKSKREKCGYIDQTGKLRIPAEFDSVQAFKHGIARVFLAGPDAKFEHMHHPQGRWRGCIDKDGEVVNCPDQTGNRQNRAQ